MFDDVALGIEFFEGLVAIDEAIAREAAEAPCRFCEGPVHRSDYARKPRGGLVGAAGEAFATRFSLCCGREGCPLAVARRAVCTRAGPALTSVMRYAEPVALGWVRVAGSPPLREAPEPADVSGGDQEGSGGRRARGQHSA